MREIYENFLALGPEKQQRIRIAALREFGRYGYRKTSTEQVAQSAGIAKGMVFHYFGSKRGLFEYLATYACAAVRGWFGGLEEEIGGLDYIEQYRKLTQIKLRAYLEQPYLFEFLTILYTQPESMQVSEKARADFEETMLLRTSAQAAIDQAENTALFREDIDAGKIKRYVSYLLDGYAQHLLAVLGGRPLAELDLDGYWQEFDEMLDDLKRLFYR